MRSFKSVGITGADLTTQNNAAAPTPLPVGIVTPLRPGQPGDGLLAMHFQVGTQMKNNLRDLILTNWGERVMSYDYGANLGPLVTEYEKGKDQFDGAAMERINRAVSKWMPFVVLEGYDSTYNETTDPGLGFITILLDYSIPRALVPTTRLQVTFAVS